MQIKENKIFVTDMLSIHELLSDPNSFLQIDSIVSLPASALPCQSAQGTVALSFFCLLIIWEVIIAYMKLHFSLPDMD